jgi:hypothetical protein
LHGVLIEGFPLAGESFPAVTIEEAMKFSPAPCLIRFGTHAPMAVFTHEDKKYYHTTQDPAQTQATESKKARKRAAAKARKARQTAVTNARELLRKPEVLSDALEPSCPITEAKVLEALNDASYSLSWSMCNARSRNNKNTLRNYRRKRSDIKKLHAEISAHVVRSTTLKQKSHVSEFLDVVREPYVLSVKSKRPNELKKLVRQAIMNEFWTRTLKRAAKFPGRGIVAPAENILLHSPMMVASYHATADSIPEENKFATLKNEVPAPHANTPPVDQLQQQFQQLQDQMKELQKQLQSRQPTAYTGGGRRPVSPVRNFQEARPFA